MRVERCVELMGRFEAQAAGGNELVSGRQRVGLKSLNDLEPVLDRPQKHVGVDERVANLTRNQPCAPQGIECGQGAALFEFRLPGAICQLQHLDKELQLPNAAASQFDV